MAAFFSVGYPLLQLDVKNFLNEFNNVEPAEAGIAVDGPAAAYALVWEWGSARISKPGPKTVWGVNPDGKRVVLTITAPRGYIRVNSPLYWAALEAEMKKVTFAGLTAKAIHAELQVAVMNAGKKILQIIREHAPYDTGELRDDLKLVPEGDPLLDEADDFGALIIGEEE